MLVTAGFDLDGPVRCYQPTSAVQRDSIFDNAAYVPGDPAVIEQLRAVLPDGWQATLLAVDGDVTADIGEHLRGLPL
jgi:hypothetical protein